mmetsp:Transcript_13380/g.41390  ORF Transcript_13380/g.41390 Transcript_13380/m.41390 type:complete len:281 (-) Transcript_13380:117-959(-)
MMSTSVVPKTTWRHAFASTPPSRPERRPGRLRRYDPEYVASRASPSRSIFSLVRNMCHSAPAAGGGRSVRRFCCYNPTLGAPALETRGRDLFGFTDNPGAGSNEHRGGTRAREPQKPKPNLRRRAAKPRWRRTRRRHHHRTRRRPHRRGWTRSSSARRGPGSRSRATATTRPARSIRPPSRSPSSADRPTSATATRATPATRGPTLNGRRRPRLRATTTRRGTKRSTSSPRRRASSACSCRTARDACCSSGSRSPRPSIWRSTYGWASCSRTSTRRPSCP